MSRVRDFGPDGLHLPKVKPHSLEKLNLHNYYAGIFATAMRKQWRNLVYVGLYSGAGAAEVEGSDRIVMTSALSVLAQDPPFTRYIFVDEDEDCIQALRARAKAIGVADRATFLQENVNDSVGAVLAALPDWKTEGSVLTFCFIDPFKIDLDFNVVRRLARLRIDILLMVPLGYDVRRNWKDYVETPAMRGRLTRFLGEEEWLSDWEKLGRSYSEFPRFVQGRLNQAMQALGFIEVQHRDIRDVKVSGKNVYLYSLHLYSKSKLAIKLWREALKGTSEQQTLDL